MRKIARSAFMIFLSTLSLRRATIVHFSTFRQSTAFLSTLSLRRATGCSCAVRCRIGISIHALLAESDTPRMFCRCRVRHFYPRSPCGERPWHMETIKLPAKISIHALLAESDNSSYGALDGASISIHALLAESDWQAGAMQLPTAPFLSTLSLRRATAAALLLGKNYVKFLSTLSLRRATLQDRARRENSHISIHALLAESDVNDRDNVRCHSQFLSTLSLRRATSGKCRCFPC